MYKEIGNRNLRFVSIMLLATYVVFCMVILGGCGRNIVKNSDIEQNMESSVQKEDVENEIQEPQQEEILENPAADIETEKQKSLINPEGATLAERFVTPEGFVRAEAEDTSLCRYLREYPLKEAGAPVLLYDGGVKRNQSAHAAVFTLPIEEADLQQCADSVMRMYAEYFWSSGQYEKIAFHFTNGFLCDYPKWREGHRVKVSGNEVSWSKDASYDDSYECFLKYMRMVFNYAGTLSMDSLESKTIPLSEMQVGDIIIKGGSPGHVVMVVDMCQDGSGKKAWLLAQGYMPAQEFHIINNLQHEDDPWYYESEMVFPLTTPEYTFSEESMIKRLVYEGLHER